MSPCKPSIFFDIRPLNDKPFGCRVQKVAIGADIRENQWPGDAQMPRLDDVKVIPRVCN